MTNRKNSADDNGNGISRRTVLKGAAVVGAVIGAGGLFDVAIQQRALAAPDPGDTTVPLPTDTGAKLKGN